MNNIEQYLLDKNFKKVAWKQHSSITGKYQFQHDNECCFSENYINQFKSLNDFKLKHSYLKNYK